MAMSRISTNTGLTSSRNERRQVEARIRALQHRTSKRRIMQSTLSFNQSINLID